MPIQQLRVKKLISVVEISNTELQNCMNQQYKPIIKSVSVETQEETEKRVAATEKKKTSKKLHEVPEG